MQWHSIHNKETPNGVELPSIQRRMKTKVDAAPVSCKPQYYHISAPCIVKWNPWLCSFIQLFAALFGPQGALHQTHLRIINTRTSNMDTITSYIHTYIYRIFLVGGHYIYVKKKSLWGHMWKFSSAWPYVGDCWDSLRIVHTYIKTYPYAHGWTWLQLSDLSPKPNATDNCTTSYNCRLPKRHSI